jgi:hypothetical protein
VETLKLIAEDALLLAGNVREGNADIFVNDTNRPDYGELDYLVVVNVITDIAERIIRVAGIDAKTVFCPESLFDTFDRDGLSAPA